MIICSKWSTSECPLLKPHRHDGLLLLLTFLAWCNINYDVLGTTPTWQIRYTQFIHTSLTVPWVLWVDSHLLVFPLRPDPGSSVRQTWTIVWGPNPAETGDPRTPSSCLPTHHLSWTDRFLQLLCASVAYLGSYWSVSDQMFLLSSIVMMWFI